MPIESQRKGTNAMKKSLVLLACLFLVSDGHVIAQVAGNKSAMKKVTIGFDWEKASQILFSLPRMPGRA